MMPLFIIPGSVVSALTFPGVIVHEAARSGSVGAEIAAQLVGEGITSLMAPVKRVSGFDTVMPLYRYEDHYMPGVNRIMDAVQEAMEYR